jgi:hypothetical protein
MLGRDPVSVLTRAGATLLGPLFASINLFLFNPLYLKRGRVPGARTGLRHSEAAPGVGKRAAGRLPDRSEQVERVGELLKAAGYAVDAFPRDPETNPLAVDVDIAARRDREICYVKVFTPEVTGRPIDWVAASELKRGAWGLSLHKGISPGSVRPMVVLLDVPPDESLIKFSHDENVEVVASTRSKLESALHDASPERARAFLHLAV